MKNIVLIGMPSSGKSCIGKAISKKMNRQFIDMDTEIVKMAKMRIPDIFKTYGEDKFRDYENELSKNLSQKSDLVIASGGGIIKRQENMDYLKRNALIFFIDRNLALLISDDPNRPLSNSKAAIKKLYHERYELYQKYADYSIKNNHDITSVVNKIIELFKKGE